MIVQSVSEGFRNLEPQPSRKEALKADCAGEAGALLVEGEEKMALYRVGYQDRYGCYQECPFTPTKGMLNIDKAKAIVARWREAGYTIIQPMLWQVGDNGRAICPCPDLDA